MSIELIHEGHESHVRFLQDAASIDRSAVERYAALVEKHFAASAGKLPALARLRDLRTKVSGANKDLLTLNEESALLEEERPKGLGKLSGEALTTAISKHEKKKDALRERIASMEQGIRWLHREMQDAENQARADLQVHYAEALAVAGAEVKKQEKTVRTRLESLAAGITELATLHRISEFVAWKHGASSRIEDAMNAAQLEEISA